MERAAKVAETLSALKRLAPSGYAIALHVNYTTPAFLFQTYPAGWSVEYSAKGLVMHDPTVQWGFHNEGAIDWADLAEQDGEGVLRRAAAHGLRHGFSAALVEGESRSMAGFARKDRPFTGDERDVITAMLADLHALTANWQAMPKAVLGALKALSVNQANPG